jgi:SAM-dependent methyltransferase
MSGNNSVYKIRTQCAICGESDRLAEIMRYGNVPLAGDFPSKNELDYNEKFDLKILFCSKCSLLQTNSIIDADRLFLDYRYMSSVGLSKHFSEVAHILNNRFNLHNKRVLEIGSNDGVLLKPLQELGINCSGFEPAKNISQVALDKGCVTINDYFNDLAVDKYSLENRYDLIVSNNCFAHIDDIHGIMRGVKKALNTDGHFVIEVHYVKSLIEQLQWDNIYHEHLYYYSLTSLKHLFDQYGMTIIDYDDIPIHSGSIRVYASNNSRSQETIKVIARLEEEKQLGITEKEWYMNFAKLVEDHIYDIKILIKDLISRGHKIAGYGASGRANMLCNLAGLTPESIMYIVDESPERSGRFISGTHIPILGPEALENKPDYILIFAWNYAKMIMNKLENKGFQFIILFPEPQIIETTKELNACGI